MPATAAELEQAVAAEMARYGSLDLAIEGLRVDADCARWGAPIHDILKAALRLRSARKATASAPCGPRSAVRYANLMDGRAA
jgi:hypothetical protein